MAGDGSALLTLHINENGEIEVSKEPDMYAIREPVASLLRRARQSSAKTVAGPKVSLVEDARYARFRAGIGSFKRTLRVVTSRGSPLFGL